MNWNKDHTPDKPMARAHHDALKKEIDATIEQLQRLGEIAGRFDPAKPGKYRITRQIRHRVESWTRDMKNYMVMMTLNKQAIED